MRILHVYLMQWRIWTVKAFNEEQCDIVFEEDGDTVIGTGMTENEPDDHSC